MNDEQIVLVKETFEYVLPMSDLVATRFYERLFAYDPALRPLFSTDMAEQRHKLMMVLSTVVHHLWRPRLIEPELRELGARHVGYGVRPEHYAIVGDALIDALRESLADIFSPTVEEAWRCAYDFVTTLMLAGATDKGNEGL